MQRSVPPVTQKLCPGLLRRIRVHQMAASPRVEDDAGDDEHGRHRQHLREHFRGRPFGGVLHADLPRPGLP